MKISNFSRAFATAIMLLFVATLTSCDSESQNIRLGSGNKGGIYHKFATSLAEQFNKAGTASTIQNKSTAGTSANIRLMEEGFLDLAIVQADVLKDFLMRSRARHAIAAVSGLYTESIQIVVSDDSKIESVADLEGKSVSVGEEESGVLRNAEIILEANGIALDKINKMNLGFKESTQALLDGKIEAFFCTAGIPTPSIAELAGKKAIRILSLDSSSIERITNLHPELTRSEIPAGTYAGQDSSAQTLGTKAVLVASLLLDSASVVKVTETLFAGGNFNVPSIEFATTNIPMEFHPGAAAVLKNKNAVVPVAAPLQGRGPIPSTGD